MAGIKHPFAGISHWVGLGLAVVGSGFLIATAVGRPLHLLAFAIYGLSLVLLYSASALYHTIKAKGKGERLLRNFDHSGIFLLISGTYVPVCLLALQPSMGTLLLILQALCAATGILCTFFLRKFPSAINLTLYLVMGWMAVAAIGYMKAHWPAYAVGWLVAGGIVYSVGAVIFALDRPHLWPGKFTAHDLWHLFVLGGSGCHFLMMTSYVAKLG